MGWTNSVPIFHDDVTHILQPEIPHVTIPYIDDVPVKGPSSYYFLEDGAYETIPENRGIRRFIWEHFENLNRILQRMKYCGGTFSGHKLYLCVPEFLVLGHRCTPQGRLPDESKIRAITNWGPCKSLTDVRAFLGTLGVCRIFIRNFAHRANALVYLTRKDIPFEFGPTQIAAQEDLKQALIESTALRAIDYNSAAPVILAVDTSSIAVGFYLCQCDEINPRKRYFSRFGSITLNDRESRFSQAKLELYGLYRALGALRLYLIGVRNLIIEVDARYIKGMLSNPDIAPSASINRWIVAILSFQFTLVHVPGTHHGPDGLSRRPRQPGDVCDDGDEQEFEDWIDRLYGFIHQINPLPFPPPPYSLDTFSLTSDLSEEDTSSPEDSYDLVPRSEHAKSDDIRLLKVRKWLTDLVQPDKLSDAEYTTFLRYCTEFFLDDDRLWKKNAQGAHKLIVNPPSRLETIRSAHDQVGHKAVYATHAIVSQRFWWPNMKADIAWFVRTCHLCQIRQTQNVLIPPIVATPAPLFAKIFIDTMHMPASGSYKYILQGRCSLTNYPEFRMLRTESAKTIGDWIYEDILCRWGSLREIVTDNGAAFLKALDYLAKQYQIKHIRISGYNSRANGIVERSHFDVRQSLFKAADGDQKKWSLVAHSVFWAERVTFRKRMGCSPYFAVTGSHPIFPFDIFEATYLQPAPDSILSSTDLIARRAIALQKRSDDINHLYSKVYDARRLAAHRFEREHEKTIHNYDFERGSLVLMRNTQIEKSLNRKMRARYLGPLIVISRNFGGAYIVSELDGTVFHRPVAAFRLLPYYPHASISIPDNLLDIDTSRLRELEQSKDTKDDEQDDDDIDEHA
jgi:transposase InsO family protein